ncbi:MAG: SDR family NAD(P)-dependent oxidoreductase, partial [candidate division NC10 bacterium]
MSLTGHVAVVTGGTGALGQAVTLRLLAEGAVVAIPYADERERDGLRARVAPADRSRLVTEPVDVTDLAAMTAFAESAVAAGGKIDILVAGVGGFAGGALLETDAATWTRLRLPGRLLFFHAFAAAR